jgi:putative ABC transport system permease protein
LALPLAAYVAIGLLLVGGIALLPWGVAWLLHRLQPVGGATLLMLALERARRMRGTAAIAVGGVVASLSLAVALTVMVASFRGSVIQWLDAVLPSPLYVRSALKLQGANRRPAAPRLCRSGGPPARRGPRATPAHQPPATGRRTPRPHAAEPPAGQRPRPARCRWWLRAARARGSMGVYISEAVVDLYGLQPGMEWPALSRSFSPVSDGKAQAARFL